MFRMKKNQKGFTLIELLIVIAIIAILAAIAIPQFSAYRIRGYNAAANSDIRNIKLAQESFRTDWSVYPSTAACAATAAAATTCTGVLGAGVIVAGPGNLIIPVAQYAIVATLYPSAAAQASFGLSSGVSAGVTTTAVTGANYTAYTAHAQGDVIYGADSDNTQIKMAGKDAAGAITTLTLKVAGTAVAAIPVSTAADDLAAAAWATM